MRITGFGNESISLLPTKLIERYCSKHTFCRKNSLFNKSDAVQRNCCYSLFSMSTLQPLQYWFSCCRVAVATNLGVTSACASSTLTTSGIVGYGIWFLMAGVAYLSQVERTTQDNSPLSNRKILNVVLARHVPWQRQEHVQRTLYGVLEVARGPGWQHWDATQLAPVGSSSSGSTSSSSSTSSTQLQASRLVPIPASSP
jgi:hypothetical protein